MLDLSNFISSSIFTLLLLGVVLILVLFTIFYLQKTEYLIYVLLVWFPIETMVLRWTPPDYYVFVKYFPEVFIYCTFLISWIRYIKKTGRLLPNAPINRYIFLYFLIAAISLFVNNYDVVVWALGVRQLTRFMLIYLIFLFENYHGSVIKNLLLIGAAIFFVEALLGVAQFAARGALDKYMFFSDTITVGNSIELEGIQEDWAPGQRVFATLGRYDRLGSFLAIGLVMLFPWIYILKEEKKREKWWIAFAVGSFALLLTYSRASWISFGAGIFVIAFFLLKDKKVLLFGSFLAGLLCLYLAYVFLTQSFGTGAIDQATGRQSLRDRVVEAVSPYSWRQSYEGYGRIFFIINTPLMVVRYYPFFGVGPGNYGGGVAASFLNTKIYDKLHLPFGIQNTWGQIDNNWLSIWGETGTFGIIVWALLFREIYRSALYVQHRSVDESEKTVAAGLCGVVVSICVLGFFGPYFEFRSLMLYFWLIVGIVLHMYRENKYSWNLLREQNYEV